MQAIDLSEARLAAIMSELPPIGPFTFKLQVVPLNPVPPVSPSTRIYLELPAGESAPARLRAALAAGGAEAVLITLPEGQPRDVAVLRTLVGLAQQHDAAALIEGDARLAASLGADGVHLRASQDAIEAYEAARAILGRDRIVGAEAGGSRHHAMTLAELGAEYVAFGSEGEAGEQHELVSWWAEVFEVPCVALGVTARQRAAALALSGADFVGVTLEAGLASDAAAARVRAIEAALAAAMTSPGESTGERA